jgi:hypothetical protein
LTQVGVLPMFASDALDPSSPAIDTAATPTGPVAVFAHPTPRDADGTEFSAVIVCDDLSCATSHNGGSTGWTSARLTVDNAGAVYVVTSPAPGAPPELLNVRTGARMSLTGEGEVVAAAFGADGRLRVILNGPDGIALVTYATL